MGTGDATPEVAHVPGLPSATANTSLALHPRCHDFLPCASSPLTHVIHPARFLSPFLPNLPQEQSDLEVLEQDIRRNIYRGMERRASSERKYSFEMYGGSHSQLHWDGEHNRHTPSCALSAARATSRPAGAGSAGPERGRFPSATSRFVIIMTLCSTAAVRWRHLSPFPPQA